MNVERKEYSYPSVTGLADIFARSWAPADGEIKAVVQIVHGMAEYGERYEEFARTLCESGFAVIINDHIGHGKSVNSKENIGYFGAELNEGGKSFVEDAHALTLLAKEEFKRPVIIMGHSMGSFVVRRYITMYSDDVKGAVICGTAGPNPALGAGLLAASLVCKIKGDKHPSKLIDSLAFGSYNKRCQGRTKFDWLSVNTDNVDRYIADDGCGFLFTASGYKNLFELLKLVNADSWYKSVPKALPMFLIAGDEDPVGNYGKGVTAVYDGLTVSGHKYTKLKLYKGHRHEILNEDGRFVVYNDVADWCDAVLKK